jgi:Ras association (RalGDS/AF-6) domain
MISSTDLASFHSDMGKARGESKAGKSLQGKSSLTGPLILTSKASSGSIFSGLSRKAKKSTGTLDSSFSETHAGANVEDEQANQISNQFKLFFSKRERKISMFPNLSGGANGNGRPGSPPCAFSNSAPILHSHMTAVSDGKALSEAPAIGTAITTSGRTWTAPDSWAVESDDKDDPNTAKKSISAKLLDETQEPSAPPTITDTAKSNTTLISSITITAAQGEGKFTFYFLFIVSFLVLHVFLALGIQPEFLGQAGPPSVSAASGLRRSSTGGLSATDGVIPPEWEASALWSIRVFRPAKSEAHLPSPTRLLLAQQPGYTATPETFVTLACPLETTADELAKALAKKFYIVDASKFQLFVVHRHAERMLARDDKPLLLQKRWLTEAGFTAVDHLNKLGRDDNRFVCKFIYAEVRELK